MRLSTEIGAFWDIQQTHDAGCFGTAASTLKLPSTKFGLRPGQIGVVAFSHLAEPLLNLVSHFFIHGPSAASFTFLPFKQSRWLERKSDTGTRFALVGQTKKKLVTSVWNNQRRRSRSRRCVASRLPALFSAVETGLSFAALFLQFRLSTPSVWTHGDCLGTCQTSTSTLFAC